MELAIATLIEQIYSKFDAHPQVLETYQNLAYKRCLLKEGWER
jgi:hypothetical protein